MSYIDGVKPGESHLVLYPEVGHDLFNRYISLTQAMLRS